MRGILSGRMIDIVEFRVLDTKITPAGVILFCEI